MATNSDYSRDDENIEINAFCYLGYTDFSKNKRIYGGTYPTHELAARKDSDVPQSAYNQDGNFKISKNLRKILQCGGAVMPKVNTGIGAPRCTFVYGGITRGKSPFFATKIKGPTEGYPEIKFDGALAGVAKTANTMSNTRTLNIAETATIPANQPNANYSNGQTAPTLTTYNIWKLAGAENLSNLKFKENYGYYWDDMQGYAGPFLTQKFDNNSVYAQVIAPYGKPATVERIFETTKDMIYEKDCKLFYPTAKTPDPVKLKPSGNAGFHLSFLHDRINEVYDDAGNIVITWQSAETSKQEITGFKLWLSATQKPILSYKHPVKGTWTMYPIEGPAMNTGEFNVFVHYVGPVMLIGFDQDPEYWNVFNPVQTVSSTYDSNDDHKPFYINMGDDTKITIIFNNINALFQYSPIAFDNFNISQYWLNPAYYASQTDKPYQSVEKLECLYKLSHAVVDKKDSTIVFDLVKTQSDFTKHAFLNEKHSDLVDSDDDGYGTGPTFYADWRKNITDAQDGVYNQQLVVENDKLFEGNVTTEKYAEIDNNCYVKWNTTIEGPMLLHVSDNPLKDSNSEESIYVDKIGDVSDYVTEWSVQYTPELENKSFVRSNATVTLKGLANTKQGQDYLAALEENVLLITLGAYENGKPNNFFQGYVTETSTKYGAISETTLTCEDLAFKVLSSVNAPTPYAFICMKFKDIIKVCMDEVGLKNNYSYIVQPHNDNTLNDAWKTMTNRRVARGFYYTSSSLTKALSINVADPPFYETIIKPVLESELGKDMYPVIYWEPTKQKAVFTSKSAECDTLSLLGMPDDIDGSINLPTDRHGVIVDTYTIQTINNNLMSGATFISKNDQGQWLTSSHKFSEYGQAAPKVPEPPTNGYGWVGFDRIHFEDLSNKWKIDMNAVTKYATLVKEAFLKTPYNNLSCSVYVTRPLRPWATFEVNTFLPSQESSTGYTEIKTDKYFYGSLNYHFDKKENTIIADIKGENIPRIVI